MSPQFIKDSQYQKRNYRPVSVLSNLTEIYLTTKLHHTLKKDFLNIELVFEKVLILGHV